MCRKLADRIQVIVAEMLETRVKDPRLGFVTITDARVTGDLREATVFYTVYGYDEERAGTAAALESAKGVLRSEVGRQTGVRHTPSLAFVADALPENAKHIEDLLVEAQGRRRARPLGRRGRRLRRRRRPVPRAARGRRRRHARTEREWRQAVHLRRPAWSSSTSRPGWTSHDVVARMRRLAGTRRVGHAGTLDPMATGVLLVGIERATRLLGHLALTDKAYLATIRLGQATVTDDAEGEVTAAAVGGRGHRRRRRGRGRARSPARSSRSRRGVSAIKVDGQRSYARVRAGEDVQLAARPVTVSRFDVLAVRRRHGDLVDVDAVVDCSTGTYVRALARDLGAALGVGGHLTALRRTRVGPFGIDRARTLEELETAWSIVSLEDVVAATFARRDLDEEQARAVSHGGRLPLDGEVATDRGVRAGRPGPGPDGAPGRRSAAARRPRAGVAGPGWAVLQDGGWVCLINAEGIRPRVGSGASGGRRNPHHSRGARR